jgi:hypothetical protein
LYAFVPNGVGVLNHSASSKSQDDEPFVVELILNILENKVALELYTNVGILVNALQFLKVDENERTAVLY